MATRQPRPLRPRRARRPASAAALAAPAQIVVGDWAGRMVAQDQPPKLAAMEAVGHTERGAPLHVGGIWFDGSLHGAVPSPKLLSLLAYRNVHTRVVGLDAQPPADRPPVNVVHLSFDAMVGIGSRLSRPEQEAEAAMRRPAGIAR